MTCANCKRKIDADEVTWPATGDGEVCEECWAAESDQAWWDTCRQMDAAQRGAGESRAEISDNESSDPRD